MLYTNKLTDLTKQLLSWVTQSRISSRFMEPYCLLPFSFCNSPPLVPILNQINPVHVHQSYLFKNFFSLSSHLGLILPSISFPSDDFYHFLAHIFLLSHSRHKPHPTNPHWFDNSNNICCFVYNLFSSHWSLFYPVFSSITVKKRFKVTQR